MKRLCRTLGPLVLAVTALSWAATARAEGLYFEKTEVDSRSELGCLRMAEDIGMSHHWRNMHESQSEVAGETEGAYVAVTCVARGNAPTIAVVMAMAPTFGAANGAGHVVAGSLNRYRCQGAQHCR